MANKTDIVNMALTNIGHETIDDIDEDGKAANQIRLQYDTALEAVLRDHPWGFAMRRVRASPLDETPVGFKYAYAYPSDCAMLLRVTGERFRKTLFEIGRSPDGRQKAVLTDCPPPAILEYTGKNMEPTEYDAKFVKALAWRLAAEIALGTTNDPGMAQAAMQTYETALYDARLSDAREAEFPGFPDGEFIRSRRF